VGSGTRIVGGEGHDGFGESGVQRGEVISHRRIDAGEYEHEYVDRKQPASDSGAAELYVLVRQAPS